MTWLCFGLCEANFHLKYNFSIFIPKYLHSTLSFGPGSVVYSILCALKDHMFVSCFSGSGFFLYNGCFVEWRWKE